MTKESGALVPPNTGPGWTTCFAWLCNMPVKRVVRDLGYCKYHADLIEALS